MSSGFISEKDLAEARETRQKEWEKVRNADQPLECPEEPYDGRSLYERLKEQKVKKDMEYEEAHKLKNLIRGLDDDEVQFLELVDQNKLDAEKKQLLEEEAEMKEFRNRKATLQEQSIEKKIQTELKPQNKTKSLTTNRVSQKALLGIGIKRKSDDPPPSKQQGSLNNDVKLITTDDAALSDRREYSSASPPLKLASITTNKFDRGALKCIAVLPGIGPYHDSSDSEVSTDSEEDTEEYGKYDLVGRKIKKKKTCEEE